MTTGIGIRIRNRRNELGISQEALAERLGLKSKSTICKIERGDDNLTTDTIIKYAEALDVTPGYLMGWEDDGIPTVVKVYKKKDGKKVEASPEEVEKAMEFYRKYQKAIPEIRSAVLALLKEDQPDS